MDLTASPTGSSWDPSPPEKVDLEGKPPVWCYVLWSTARMGAQTWQPVYSQSSAGDAEPGSCTSPGLQDGRLTTIQEGPWCFPDW